MKFHSTKILVLMIVCNLLALTGYYFLFQRIKTQTQTASALINTIDLGQQKNSHLNALRSVVKDTQHQRDQLAVLLLPSDGEVPFIEQIETLAKNSGLQTKTNNVSSIGGDTETTKTFQMQEETTGSWNNTLYFLNQLENLPYNIRVQRISLQGQIVVGKSTAPSWTATFDISVTEKK